VSVSSSGVFELLRLMLVVIKPRATKVRRRDEATIAKVSHNDGTSIDAKVDNMFFLFHSIISVASSSIRVCLRYSL
jgi:hypothetical protein